MKISLGKFSSFQNVKTVSILHLLIFSFFNMGKFRSQEGLGKKCNCTAYYCLLLATSHQFKGDGDNDNYDDGFWGC